MSEAEPRREAREFGPDDARALESDAGRECRWSWSAAAVETVAAIILWEACKAESAT